MTRTTTAGLSKPLAVLLTVLALLVVGVATADAAKPEPLTSASATFNADCSVDVSFTLNQRGRPVEAIAVWYRQQGTLNGTPLTFTNLSRGQWVTGWLAFVPGPAAFGASYEVSYTAFAKNGHILDQGIVGTYDTSGC